MNFSSFIKTKLFVSSNSPVGALNVLAPVSLPYSFESIKTNPTANRCINMITDAAAAITYEVKSGVKLSDSISSVRPDKITTRLNRLPNSYMDIGFFKRSIVLDLITDGNAFILVEGDFLYYLPAANVTVVAHPNTLVSHYEMDGGKVIFKRESIIHIKDNNSASVHRGESRLKSIKDIVDLHKKMKDFQKNFFVNNAMPGIILSSPNTLTDKLKKRKLEEWRQEYNPTSGARRPAFLDGGITVDNITTSTFREMDFETSIQSIEKDISRSLGVPPLLLDGGNNANITPNHRLFYLETILPICTKIAEAFSLYYGYEIKPKLTGVPAMQPDLRELGAYVASIVNGGIAYPNEGRELLGLLKDPDPENDKIRIPANVAGSAANPSQGGRPTEPKEGDK